MSTMDAGLAADTGVEVVKGFLVQGFMLDSALWIYTCYYIMYLFTTSHLIVLYALPGLVKIDFLFFIMYSFFHLSVISVDLNHFEPIRDGHSGLMFFDLIECLLVCTWTPLKRIRFTDVVNCIIYSYLFLPSR